MDGGGAYERDRSGAAGLPSRTRFVGAAVLAATLAFVVVASRNIEEPGIYPDEMRHVVPALAFVEGELPTNAVPGTGPGISIGEHELTAMVVPYVGSLKTVALAPIVAVFDISAESVRYFAIFVAALALLATFAFARRLFRSEAVALVALVLLALDPGFIFYARHDFDTTVWMMLAKGVGIWQLLRWWDTGRTGSLVLGAFVLGLGLYDKFTFIWLLLALAGATAIVAGRAVWNRLDLRTLSIGVAGFLAGCLPLVIYNLRSGFGTLNNYEAVSEADLPRGTAFPPDEPVVPSGSFLSQLEQRGRVLGDLLDGSTASRMIDAPFPQHFEVLPFMLAAAALAICIQLVARRPPSHELRAGAFAVLVVALVLIAAAVTEPGFHGHHLILAYPFPHLAIALVVVQLARLIARAGPPPRRRVLFAAVAAVLALIPITFAAITTGGMFDTFSQRAGRGVWSNGIYELERYLTRAHRSEPVVTADWGLAEQLVALSQGRLHVHDVAYELAFPDSPAQPAELVSEPMRDARSWYVLRRPDATAFEPARRRFFAAVERLGGRPSLIRTLDDSEGRSVYEVYVVDSPRSSPADRDDPDPSA
jgi:Dolichyl-phosphate-mannose-protein mannosyltransferase